MIHTHTFLEKRQLTYKREFSIAPEIVEQPIILHGSTMFVLQVIWFTWGPLSESCLIQRSPVNCYVVAFLVYIIETNERSFSPLRVIMWIRILYELCDNQRFGDGIYYCQVTAFFLADFTSLGPLFSIGVNFVDADSRCESTRRKKSLHIWKCSSSLSQRINGLNTAIRWYAITKHQLSYV